MNGRLTIEPVQSPRPLRLRSIGPADIEDLRSWKNENRQAFFFKDEITADGQKRWFEGYLGRPDDYMFVVESGALRAGCMGFRLDGAEADCYNIIGAPEGRGQGLLKGGMRLMCSYILKDVKRLPALKVLADNSAAGFYQSCGYTIEATRDGYHRMKLSPDFSPEPYQAERS